MSTARGQRCLSKVLSSAILLGFAFPAMASLYHAEGIAGIAGDGHDLFGLVRPEPYSVDDGVQAGGGVRSDIEGLHAQANSAAAGLGGVHAHAFAQIFSPALPFISYDVEAFASASATYSDVRVSGLGSGSILTSLNLNLSGGILYGSSADPGSKALALTQAFISVLIDGTLVGSGRIDERMDTQFGRFILDTGLLSGWNSGNTGVVTSDFTVQSGVPFEVELRLTAVAVATLGAVGGGHSPGGTAEANSDFGNTLTFALNGPIFNLPDGFTVNSTEAHIANNQLAPVPIPNSLALMACAMFCFSFLGIRNKGQSMVRERNDRSRKLPH